MKSPRRSSKTSRPARRRRPERYVLVLYVTGPTPLSMRAIRNIRSICDGYLKDCHSIKIIDLYEDPKEAAAGNVIAAPTMVKSLPLPVQKFIGDMSDKDSILARLKLPQ